MLKQLRASIVADAHAAAMLRHEARIAMQLGHSNIAHVLDVCQQDDGRLFLVLEFIHGWVRNWGWTIIFTTLLIKLVV